MAKFATGNHRFDTDDVANVELCQSGDIALKVWFRDGTFVEMNKADGDVFLAQYVKEPPKGTPPIGTVIR